jgi:hypothetical protein
MFVAGGLSVLTPHLHHSPISAMALAASRLIVRTLILLVCQSSNLLRHLKIRSWTTPIVTYRNHSSVMSLFDWDEEVDSGSDTCTSESEQEDLSDDGSVDESQENDPEAAEMEGFVVSDGKGERWGWKMYRAPEELEHLQTEEERQSIQDSSL